MTNDADSSSKRRGAEISGRLRLAIGDSSQAAFARKSGISESLVRQYLTGTMPSADRLVRMADATGVRVEWLAAGRGPMRESAAKAAFAAQRDLLLKHSAGMPAEEVAQHKQDSENWEKKVEEKAEEIHALMLSCTEPDLDLVVQVARHLWRKTMK